MREKILITYYIKLKVIPALISFKLYGCSPVIPSPSSFTKRSKQQSSIIRHGLSHEKIHLTKCSEMMTPTKQ